MKAKIKAGRKKILVAPIKNKIMQYGGRLHEKYIKKKINVNRVRNLVDYSDL